MICDDAGPGYAISMGWAYKYLDEFDRVENDETFIVDNRVQQNEIEKLEKLVSANSGNRFFFKVVDPYQELYASHYYYQFLSKISQYKNAYLLSVYEPRELTAEVSKLFQNRFIHLPYPYIKSKEVETSRKRKKILISGSLNKDVYPYRYRIWEIVTRSVSRIFFFSILKHPGYAEMDSHKSHSHNLIKGAFIDHLSLYKYMLLCPSRCGIEFLKYNECAYAGCIPVGLAPGSYPDGVKAIFLSLRPEKFLKDVLKIFFSADTKNRLAKLRTFLTETRNPEILNIVLNRFIDENPIHTS